MTRFTPVLALGLGVVFGSMPVLVARRRPVPAAPADTDTTVVGPTRTPSREPVVTRTDGAPEPTAERPGPRVPVG
jgi:hypothetical protein